SSLIRASKLRFLTRAGPEIGVASTKAFTTQLAALFVLALVLGRLRGRLSRELEQTHLQSLRHLPAAINEGLAVEPKVAQWRRASRSRSMRYFSAAASIGRSRWKARSS